MCINLYWQMKGYEDTQKELESLGHEVKSESRSVVSDSLRPHGIYSPWNSPGQNTGVSSLFLLQGIFPTQVLNSGLPHRRQILYHLSHLGSPRKWKALDKFGCQGLSWNELVLTPVPTWAPLCICCLFSIIAPKAFSSCCLAPALEASWFFSLTFLTGKPSVPKSEPKETNCPHSTGLQAELEETTHQIQTPPPQLAQSL